MPNHSAFRKRNDSLTKRLRNLPDLSGFFPENDAKNTIDVCVSRHLALHAVALGCDQLRQQGLNILQVVDPLDAKDHEAVPLSRVARADSDENWIDFDND